VLDQITPVLLTFNEEANIARTLAKLAWASDIVVVDSGSTDATLATLKAQRNVRVFHRAFDSHSAQWTYAVTETGIRTTWILALDADYIATDELIREISQIEEHTEPAGYRVRFIYCLDGKPLRGTIYPPVTVLYRRASARYRQDGHTQRVVVEGAIGQLHAPMLHDDRKPFSRWLSAQARYVELEVDHLLSTPADQLSFGDKLRRHPYIAPFAVFLVLYFGKGLFLDGLAGLVYVYQRFMVELMLAARLMQRRIETAARTPD